MEINRASRFRTAIGKLAVVVGLAVGVLQVWNLGFRSNEKLRSPRVTGTIDNLEFQLPPDLLSQIEAVRALGERPAAEEFFKAKEADFFDSLLPTFSLTVDRFLLASRTSKGPELGGFSRFLKNNPEPLNALKEPTNRLITYMLSDYAKKGWTGDYVYRLRDYRSYFLIKIENEGETQASSVELIVPYKGIVRIEVTGEKPRSNEFDGKLIVGNILPKGSVTLGLWSDSLLSVYPWEIEKWRLSYAEGLGTVRFSKGQ